MDIVLTIMYLHPTLEFGVDFKVTNDGQGGGDIITWLSEVKTTEPTTAQLDAAWILVQAKQVKDADIEAFRKCDGIITQLKAKKVELDDIFANDGCPAGNKTEITNAIAKLTTRIATEETARNTLITQGITDYGVGIGNDYGDEIVNNIAGNI